VLPWTTPFSSSFPATLTRRHHCSLTRTRPKLQTYAALGTPLRQEAAAALSRTGVCACCFPPVMCPRSRTLGPVPRCCRPAPGVPPVAEPLPFFPLRTSNMPYHGHDVRTGTSSPMYKMMIFTELPLKFKCPLFLRSSSDSSHSSCVGFVSSRSTQ
jgi:hypothetical protein